MESIQYQHRYRRGLLDSAGNTSRDEMKGTRFNVAVLYFFRLSLAGAHPGKIEIARMDNSSS